MGILTAAESTGADLSAVGTHGRSALQRFVIWSVAEYVIKAAPSDVLAIPPNMARLPGLSVPCGLSEGLPVGLQIVGPQFAENRLFRVGYALEKAIGFAEEPPDA